MILAAAVQKPKALRTGSRFAPFAPASPSHAEPIEVGRLELSRLGFAVTDQLALTPEAYFAGSTKQRQHEFLSALQSSDNDALIATRGGYGSVYLLDENFPATLPPIKPVVGFSDLTTLQIYLWQKHRWVSFYGPMLAAGLNYGVGEPHGYDESSFRTAITESNSGWTLPLQGESLVKGSAEGILLGGAITLLEGTLGTPWEAETDGAILLLEDRGMRPYQIDRVLMHLKLAGKLSKVRAIVAGDFPECEPSLAGSPSVRDVCVRILGPLGIPTIFGAPVGHTARPMLTVPLGVRARLTAEGQGTLEILEPAVIA
jgi:muramoyltetrapeptide carboxypeptidase